MLRTILSRLAVSALLLLLVMAEAFFLITLSPRQPEMYRLGEDASPSAVRELRDSLGIDRPLMTQFVHWVADATRGDLGRSYVTDRPVTEELAIRAPRTLSLLALSMLIATVIGFAIGMGAAMSQGMGADRLLGGGAALLQAVPGFWLGILLVTIFALILPWLPATGYVAPGHSLAGWLASLVLPAFALGLPSAAVIGRQLRSALIRELSEEYVRCAVATGASRRTAVLRHALPNALGPVVTTLGFQVVVQLSTSVVVERVFAIDGLGTMALDAVFRGDTPTLLAAVLTFGALVLLVNLLVDLAYGRIDPRVRIA